MSRNKYLIKNILCVTLGAFLESLPAFGFVFSIETAPTTYYLSQFSTLKDAFDTAANGNILIVL